MNSVADQHSSTARTAAYSRYCNASSSAAPSSLADAANALSGAGQNKNDPYGCSSNPGSAECQQCSRNPNLAACQNLVAAANENSENEKTGETASFDTDAGRSKDQGGDLGGFNIPGSAEADPGLGGALNSFANAVAQTVATVANNSGGSIPGGGGSGGGAKLDGGQRGRPSTGQAGFDMSSLDQGLRSGGGYSQPGGNPVQLDDSYNTGGRDSTNPDGTWAGGRGLASDGAPVRMGQDLRQFLPGGANDPNRAVGGYGIMSNQINGPNVNMFNKISSRIIEKCRLGQLFDCN